MGLSLPLVCHFGLAPFYCLFICSTSWALDEEKSFQTATTSNSFESHRRALLDRLRDTGDQNFKISSCFL